MSATKASETKKSAAGRATLGSLLRQHARRLFMIALVVGSLSGGGYAIWRAVEHDVLRHDQYRLTVEQFTVTPAPPWIRADVRQDCFNSGAFDHDLWLHDPQLAERVSKTFALHPWVARVERVAVRGATVQVDVDYRRPVCMVEVVPGGVYPVDVEGVLLPNDGFTPSEARQYPRLAGITRVPPKWEVGMPWRDLHVVGGAEIAAALVECWGSLRLDHIAPLNDGTADIQFELVPRGANSRGKDRIIWGHAPNTSHPGEATTEQKIAQLKLFVAESNAAATHGPRQIDLRRASAAHTALNPERDSELQ